MKQQLALGTAQFGLDYGITNRRGRVAVAEAAAMLQAAWDGGVRMLDTAPAYGDSERSLGQASAQAPERRWRIVTKTLPLRTAAVAEDGLAAVEAAFRGSLRDLGVPAVDTLLVHHADDLLVPGGEALYAWLRGQADAGRTQRIGASVYDGGQVRELLARYRLDVVQLPASIADQRLLRDGSVQRLADAGTEIHVRSLYLQGVLLAAPEFVAARFPAQAAWAQRFHEECHARGESALQACLSFFRGQPAFQAAVVGAASVDDLRSALVAWEAAVPMDWSAWAVDNPAFTDPRLWKSS